MSALDIFPTDRTRFFSHARHALMEGLRCANIRTGDTVLYPSFICRDLLSSAHAVGAKVAYYPVGHDMCPLNSHENWPESSAVIAVNYFGFPQNLERYRSYCERTGATLIEDNAHGFLSCDESGRWLGTRADIGIFSMRKTLSIPNGAALLVNRDDYLAKLAPQLSFKNSLDGMNVRLKSALKNIPGIGLPMSNLVIGLVRGLRKTLFGYGVPASSNKSEMDLPAGPRPHGGLLASLASINPHEERVRRRALYAEFASLLEQVDLEEVFSLSDDLIAPYGFVFRATDSVANDVKGLAFSRGLDVFKWPDLPLSVTDDSPGYYRNLWVVNLLW